MSAIKEQLGLFLSYLSETHTKGLSLHDLVTSRSRPEEVRISLNINEAFTYYHSARVLYTSAPALENSKSEPFFQVFENFYLELKQHFFNEEDETHQLSERLEEMKIAFEQLTDDYNVLQQKRIIR